MKTTHKFKLAGLVLLLIVLVVVVLQNTGTTALRFFGWEIEASRIFLFSAFTLAGFVAGVLSTLVIQHRHHSHSGDNPPTAPL